MTEVKYKAYDIDTGYLFPPSLADFLGPEDEVHIFREITEQLDVSHLDSGYSGMGQHPYHPRMLLRLLMWGMANRVVSTRRIEVAAHRDVSFIYLAGGQRPDYRTLARFRRGNAEEIKRLFKETVLLCVGIGMVDLGHVALDGTKLRGNTSRHKAMSYGRMKVEEERLGREIEELMEEAEVVDREEDEVFGEERNGYELPEELRRREERLKKIRQLREQMERQERMEQGCGEGEKPAIAEKEQRSFADPDARMMLMKRGEFEYGYNAQVCVDESQGVIVAGELSNQASDGGHLPGMVEQVRELRGEMRVDEDERVTQVSADSAYFSVENIRQEGRGIELLIASRREGKERTRGEGKVYGVEDLDYIKEEDSWRCPGGRILVRQEKKVPRGRPMMRWYVCQDCEGCEQQARCLRPGEERRSLLVKRKQLIRSAMRARLKEPEKQAVYRKRKWVAEQNIGNVKGGMGFRGFTVRGQEFVHGQWFFVLAVHNVMKAVRFLIKSKKRSGALATQRQRTRGHGNPGVSPWNAETYLPALHPDLVGSLAHP
jgi:transposase